MKKLLLLFFLLPAIATFAQQTPKPAAKKAADKLDSKKITLVCKLWEVPLNIDSINLYEYSGLANRVVARAGRRLPDSAWVFTLPASKPRIYGVGVGENAVAKVILGEEKEVTLWGNVNYMDKARTVNSPANKALENVFKQIELFRSESETVRNQYFNTVNAFERNAKARSACIEHYGAKCIVCGFNFQEKYGEIGKDFIHVHHIKPLGEIGAEYKVDPINDLRPVCPNCHAMLHKRKPPFSINELRSIIKG